VPALSLPGLILTGDELVADCRALADAWDPNSREQTGKPSQWIHFDRHSRWFADVKTYLIDRFGANSREVERWDSVSNGGHTRYDPNDREPNPYLSYLLLYRLSVAHLKQLRAEESGPSTETTPPSSDAPDPIKILEYVRQKVGVLGLLVFITVIGSWLVIANAKTFKEGVETIQSVLFD
jgi:hypothetical protein